MTVTLFSLTTCTMCKVVEQRLTNKGIRFQKVLIDDDDQMREEFVSAGYTTMPVIRAEKEGQKVLEFAGFSDNRITQLRDLVFSS